MITDEIFRAAAARKNQFTAAELAEDLGVPRESISKELKALKDIDAAHNDTAGRWTLTCRRTEARDRAVKAALDRHPGASRAELNDALPSHSPAQIYTSLQRLILKGQARQERDGTRTPRYSLAQSNHFAAA